MAFSALVASACSDPTSTTRNDAPNGSLLGDEANDGAGTPDEGSVGAQDPNGAPAGSGASGEEGAPAGSGAPRSDAPSPSDLGVAIEFETVGEISDPSSSSGTPDVCETIELGARTAPPRVLLLQDLSPSMISVWEPLRAAMAGEGGLVPTFGERMSIGLVPFPSINTEQAATIGAMSADDFRVFTAANVSCEVNADAVIPPVAGNATRVTAAFESIIGSRLVGLTPTGTALTRAFEVLVDQDPMDGSAGYVILVTDGDPKCVGGGNTIDSVETRIVELAAAGVETFVVGYNFEGEALDDWAAAGSIRTGPRAHFSADDQATLNAEISTILETLVPCEYELSRRVVDPQFVRVTVDAVDREFGALEEGWRLTEDRQTIVLGDSVCDEAQGTGEHTIEVVVECEPVEIVVR